MGMKQEKRIKDELLSWKKKIIRRGNTKAAISEAKETYRNINTTKIKIEKDISAAKGCMASNNPNIVAIPFPPLKAVKIGKRCPITAAAPIANCNSKKFSEEKISLFKKNDAYFTDIHPLKTSIRKTGTPALYPKTLKVFVAPEFPLPYSLTSIL